METQKWKTNALAYLAGAIPALSETFIYREIIELERRGYVLKLYALRAADRASLSAESLPLCDKTYHILPVKWSHLVGSHAYFSFRKPVAYFRSLWKMLTPFHHRFGDRWGTLMHWGEGVVLARKMHEDGITHLHSHYIDHIASVARTVHLLTGIPYSISAHAADIWHERLLIREKVAEAKFVACCSGNGRAELLKQANPVDSSKVHVIYHGIDIRRFIPTGKVTRSADGILAVGRLDPAKGFDDLINACQELAMQGVAFNCKIVGQGTEKDRLVALIDQHGLREKVQLVGAIPQEQLLSYYHQAAIFALPCIKYRGTYFDGLPNVLVEAMATELPVVSTPVSAIPELVEDGRTGLLVPPHNPKDLAFCLARLLKDAGLRQRIGTQARAKVVQYFDNRKTIDPLIALFAKAEAL